ncbi:MAG: glycosyltransferase family 2 protein [Anaerorhabdus sp.]|uniref:glycosyltransferase family 2 protein n=1 Tax=Anaerorhabdus sp. TaxID=1872524 RepID=UPI002FC9DF5A
MKVKNEVFVSIITPTYNRNLLLIDAAESLNKQTNKNFEWIIINDGSTDNTKEIVEEIIRKYDFRIKAITQQNKGKAQAINVGVNEAHGEYVLFLDDDDYITEEAIQQIINVSEFGSNDKIAGLGFLRFDKTSRKTLSGEINPRILSSLEVFDRNIVGDKVEVFKTKILKKFPFPQFGNEKFVPEALVWNRIASSGFKIYWTNIPIYGCEYLATGLSCNIDAVLMDNILGYSQYIKEILSYNLKIKTKFRQLVAYNRRCYLRQLNYEEICSFIRIGTIKNIPFYLFGILFYYVRKKRN